MLCRLLCTSTHKNKLNHGLKLFLSNGGFIYQNQVAGFIILVGSYLFEQRHTVVVVIFDDVNHHHCEHRPEAKKDEETQERQYNDDCSLWTSHNAMQCNGASFIN